MTLEDLAIGNHPKVKIFVVVNEGSFYKATNSV